MHVVLFWRYLHTMVSLALGCKVQGEHICMCQRLSYFACCTVLHVETEDLHHQQEAALPAMARRCKVQNPPPID